MARIQILELPSEVVGETVTVPFALILDQMGDEAVDREAWIAFGKSVDARAVAVFNQTIDIPANQ